MGQRAMTKTTISYISQFGSRVTFDDVEKKKKQYTTRCGKIFEIESGNVYLVGSTIMPQTLRNRNYWVVQEEHLLFEPRIRVGAIKPDNDFEKEA